MIPPFLHFSSFAPAGIRHGFFGRTGGTSTGIYSSLNCGPGSNDTPQNVAENRARVAAAMGARAENLSTLYQVHGTKCLSIDSPVPQDRPQGDALITQTSNLVLGILTADCAPVLFWGKTKDTPLTIAAAHAGWRGALDGILESVVRAFEVLHIPAASINAVVGPCISRASYAVGQDMMEKFLATDSDYESFFREGKTPDHPHFDLEGFCAHRLRRAGVDDILLSGQDTYSQPEHYFSYRRTTHRKEEDYGRQLSVICIVE
jgi:YfiH family protein